MREVEKQALKKKGWHETIQAAAIGANRVWESENGWLGYKSGEDEMDKFRDIGDRAVTPEKLQIPLHVAASKLSNQSVHDAASSPVSGGNDAGVAFPVAWEEQQMSAPNQDCQGMSGRGTPYSTAVLAGCRKTAKPLTVRRTAKSTKAQQTLVHTKPTIIHKTKNQDGVATDDSCWPYLQQEKRGDSATPLLNQTFRSEKGGEEAGFGPPSRERTKPSTTTRDEKYSQPRNSCLEQPLPPPQIERLSGAPAGAREQQASRFHSVPPEKLGVEGQNVSTAKSTNRSSLSPLRGRWVESMRRATAPLAKEGHSWDPKNGFANLYSADMVCLRPPSQSSQPPAGSQLQEQQLQQTILLNSPANVLERMIAERRKYDPPGRKESERASFRASAANLYKCTQGLEHHHQSVVRTDENQSTIQEQIEVVMVPNSSASAFLQGKGRDKFGAAALNFEEDEDYLLHAAVVATPNVAVKKEKVSKDELGLFPTKTAAAVTTWRSSCHGLRVSPEGKLDKQRHTNVQVRSCRVSGPIDVEKAENLSWLSSETSDASHVWDSEMFENDSVLKGSLSPNRNRRRLSNGKPKGRRYQSWQFLLGQQQVLSGNQANFEHTKQVNPNESNYATFRELMEGKTWTKSRLKDYNSACSSAGLQHSMSPINVGKAGILKTSGCHVPEEIAPEDGSQLSSHLSLALSQGWQSFLKKKVNKESVAAGVPQQKMHQEDKAQSKEEKIKKTVSFASDVSDSLLHDSIFEFSVSDMKPSGSPTRPPAIAGPPPVSPKNNYRARLSSPKCPELLQSSKIKWQSSEEAKSRVDAESQTSATKHSPGGPPRLNMPLELPPRRIHQHSFGTDVSPLTSHNEEKEYLSQESGSSFFQRLGECHPLTAHQVQPGAGRSQQINGGKELPLAYQLYLQSRKAAETVEEMMEFLQKEKVSGCSSFRRDNRVKQKQHGDNGTDGTRMKDSEKAALEQARAKVEAMVSTLYYAGRNGGFEEAP